MNEKKTNELKDKKSELTTKRWPLDKGFQNIKYQIKQKIFEKNGRPTNNYSYWDLSGGFLGI